MVVAPEAVIRRAVPDDANAVAEVFFAARADVLPNLPQLHTEAETRAYLAQVLASSDNHVWVAADGGKIVGFLSLREAWVDHLYLRPGWYDRQIGTQLLDMAKQERPDGLRLYCFQCNARARAFYEARGFVMQRMTDGADNEEREPDIEYAWNCDPR